MNKAQTADKDVDVSSDVAGYKQAVDKLSASISASVGSGLLSEEADVVVDARELEGKMQQKLTQTIDKAREALLGSISLAQTRREPGRLAANLETLVADEVLRDLCGDAVESAQEVLATLRAEREEKERVMTVSEVM